MPSTRTPGFTRASLDTTGSGIRTSLSPVPISSFRRAKGIKGSLLCLFLCLGAVSCNANGLAGLSREAFFEEIQSGNLAPLAQMNPAEIRRLVRDEPDAAYWLARIYSEQAEGSLQLDPWPYLVSALPSYSGLFARTALPFAAQEGIARMSLLEDSSAQRKLLSDIEKKLLPALEKQLAEQNGDPLLSGALEDVRILLEDADTVSQHLIALTEEVLDERLHGRAQLPALRAAISSLNEEEQRIISARLLVYRQDYGPALRQFDNLSPPISERIASLSPWALADYGKALQFSGAAEKGALLFEVMDEQLSALAPEALSIDRYETMRFVLQFFAGRMYRQLGKGEDARRLFERSIAFAPDSEQKDAAIWYVLDSALSSNLSQAIEVFEKLLPLASDRNYFYTLLDRLQGGLLAQARYGDVARVHVLINTWGGDRSLIRSSWIIARLIDTGLLDGRSARTLLGIPLGISLRSWTDERYRFIFDTDTASFYYRSLAALVLGDTVNPIPSQEVLLSEAPLDITLQGEFRNMIIAHERWSYARALDAYTAIHARDMPYSSIREAAQVLSRNGFYIQSIRTIGRLNARPGYRLLREDMELLYPRAYQYELDIASSTWGVPKELMAGLARSESAFAADIVSHAGAVGLVQLMPATAREVAGKIGSRVPLVMNGGLPDLTDPLTNSLLGAWYLADWIRRLESPMLALFAYNAGPSRVRRWRAERPLLPEDLFLETVPFTETRNYGRRVLAASAVYGYLYYGYSLEQVAQDLFADRELFSPRAP